MSHFETKTEVEAGILPSGYVIDIKEQIKYNKTPFRCTYSVFYNKYLI